jgi:sensor domain CHASE-containing protein
MRAFEIQKQNLLTSLQDYANWQDLANPKTGKDPAWLEINVIGWVPAQFKIDVVVLADRQGKVFASHGLPEEFGSDVSGHPMFRSAVAGADNVEFTHVSTGLLMLASAPIAPPPAFRDGFAMESSPGVLMFGKMMTDDVVAEISEVIGNELKVLTNPVPEPYAAAYREEETATHLYGYEPLIGIDGSVVGTLRVERDRMSARLVRDRATRTAIGGAAAGLLTILVLALLMSVYLARPLVRLAGSIRDFGAGKATKMKSSGRNDELGMLEDSFVGMMQELGASKRKVSVQEQELERANRELAATAEELRHAKIQLEEKLVELEKSNHFMVGRELKMSELKKEIDELKKGRPKPATKKS